MKIDVMKRIGLIAAAGALAASPALAGGTPLTTERVATNLTSPLYVTHAPGDFERLFILEQPGRIKILDFDTGDVTVFLDIDSRASLGFERGLLGLAFHPDYQNNGFFYVNYTDNSGETRVSRFSVDPSNPDLGDPNSEVIILRNFQPFANHNAGWIEFGPDGYLYISSGDGGSGGDPGNRAQDITNQPLGKMLRIDVDGTGASTGNPTDPYQWNADGFVSGGFGDYGIPADNPFVGAVGDDQIWQYGLRNAWRPAFDALTGDLYIADVGQGAREEINFQPANSIGGENWGWRCYEGDIPFNTTGCAPASAYDFPIYDYVRSGGNCSITGGVVYRGLAIPDLQGTYFFSDFCSRRTWSFRYSQINGVQEFEERTSELQPISPWQSITSWGEDAYGEIYIVHGAFVERVVPVGGPLNDCNNNGVEDALEILDGSASDINDNGVPDSCEPGCGEDVTGDFVVDVLDLNRVLGAFNQPAAADPDADVNGDGTIDVLDLNALLALFNQPCP
jgi:glucose/arabinose dehydrogenase